MESFQSQEKDYGTELGMPMRAPFHTTAHPLQDSERHYKESQEGRDLENAKRNFGIGFALHLKHEQAATGCKDIGHLPFIQRHDVLHHSLTGRDLQLHSSDVFNIEPEFTAVPYIVMEKSKMFFRK